MMWATLGAAVPVALEGVRPARFARQRPARRGRAGGGDRLGRRRGRGDVRARRAAGERPRGGPADARRPRPGRHGPAGQHGALHHGDDAPPAQDCTLLSGDKNAVLVTRAVQRLPRAERALRPSEGPAGAPGALGRVGGAVPDAACTTRRLTAHPVRPGRRAGAHPRTASATSC